MKFTHHTMIQGVADPVQEGHRGEKVILLSQLIQLRVSVEHPSADELVEDADNKRRQNGEDNIVERHRPALEGDLTGEIVEPGVLRPMSLKVMSRDC